MRNFYSCRAGRFGRVLHHGSLSLMLSLSLLATGCIPSHAERRVALAATTVPVADQAAAAYRAANALHDLQQDYEAVATFDDQQRIYNPRTIQPLMSEADIQVRLAVLIGFQEYVASLVAILNGHDWPQLQVGTASAGQSLGSGANLLPPSTEFILGSTAAAHRTPDTVINLSGSTVTTSNSSAPDKAITPLVQKEISTAVNALGQFLTSRKIKRQLPQTIQDMDPHVAVLCSLLESEIDILQDQEQRDYNYIINRQTIFIRAFPKIDPEARTKLIMKLPEIVRQERKTGEQLSQLRAALVRLELTHHALASAAQSNNHDSLKAKLMDLAVAGGNLGTYQSSPPTH